MTSTFDTTFDTPKTRILWHETSIFILCHMLEYLKHYHALNLTNQSNNEPKNNNENLAALLQLAIMTSLFLLTAASEPRPTGFKASHLLRFSPDSITPRITPRITGTGD